MCRGGGVRGNEKGVHGRRDGHCSGIFIRANVYQQQENKPSSYWNAFLFLSSFIFHNGTLEYFPGIRNTSS